MKNITKRNLFWGGLFLFMFLNINMFYPKHLLSHDILLENNENVDKTLSYEEKSVLWNHFFSANERNLKMPCSNGGTQEGVTLAPTGYVGITLCREKSTVREVTVFRGKVSWDMICNYSAKVEIREPNKAPYFLSQKSQTSCAAGRAWFTWPLNKEFPNGTKFYGYFYEAGSQQGGAPMQELNHKQIVSETVSIPNGIYHIKLAANGMSLDANQANINGGKISIWSFHGGNNQKWAISEVSEGIYTIKSVASGKVIDAAADRVQQNGCPITVWDAVANSKEQQWKIYSADNGRYTFKCVATNSNKVIDVSEAKISNNGQAIHLWDSNKQPNQLWILEPVLTPSPPSQQEHWRWCSNCQALFFGDLASRCPKGGAHIVNTRNYILSYGTGAIGQVNWRWCNKCSGIFYNGFSTRGVCPSGGQHDGSTSNDYHLNNEAAAPSQQGTWRWCNKCYVLNYGGLQGVCPAGGVHENGSSGDYKLSLKD